MSTTDKRVLITGISGFVGTNLREYFKKKDGFKISGSSRDKKTIEPLSNQIDGIFSFEELFEKEVSFHSYVHLSGKVHNLRDKHNDQEYFEANFENVKRLFQFFLKDLNSRKFIFLSTIHVLTENPDVILDEDYIPRPFTPYGRSKYKAEKYLLENCPANKDVYILRPSMIHGPGNKGNLNSLFRLIKSGLPYPLGAVNNKRSFVSIENLCFIIEQIIQGEISSGLYHIADDDPTYTHDLIHLIANETGKKARIWNISLTSLEIIAKIGNIFPLPIDDHRLIKLTGDFLVSNKKIKKAIGKPLPVHSIDGLRKTIKSLIQPE